jgi:hypothetical protein
LVYYFWKPTTPQAVINDSSLKECHVTIHCPVNGIYQYIKLYPFALVFIPVIAGYKPSNSIIFMITLVSHRWQSLSRSKWVYVMLTTISGRWQHHTTTSWFEKEDSAVKHEVHSGVNELFLLRQIKRSDTLTITIHLIKVILQNVEDVTPKRLRI